MFTIDFSKFDPFKTRLVCTCEIKQKSKQRKAERGIAKHCRLLVDWVNIVLFFFLGWKTFAHWTENIVNIVIIIINRHLERFSRFFESKEKKTKLWEKEATQNRILKFKIREYDCFGRVEIQTTTKGANEMNELTKRVMCGLWFRFYFFFFFILFLDF